MACSCSSGDRPRQPDRESDRNSEPKSDQGFYGPFPLSIIMDTDLFEDLIRGDIAPSDWRKKPEKTDPVSIEFFSVPKPPKALEPVLGPNENYLPPRR